MKLLQYFTAALFTLSIMGCCCGRSYVMDPNDPCGGYVDSGCGGCGGGFPWSWKGRCGRSSSCGCGGGWGDDYSMGSGGCAGGCGAPTGAPSAPGCGCGQSAYGSDSGYPASYPSYPGSSVPSYDGTSVPSLRSAPVPPDRSPTPATNIPPAIPGSDSTSQFQQGRFNGQSQMVSYEEFQRLPGTIISGPGAAPALSNGQPQIQQTAATNQPFLAPPSPTTTANAQRNSNGQITPTGWLPAQSN